MDGYPPGSLDHNVPFLAASGLSSSPPPEHKDGDGEYILQSDMPGLEGENAHVLHAYLQSIDATQPPWDQGGKNAPYRYRVASVGRVRSFSSIQSAGLPLTCSCRPFISLPATPPSPKTSSFPKSPPYTPRSPP